MRDIDIIDHGKRDNSVHADDQKPRLEHTKPVTSDSVTPTVAPTVPSVHSPAPKDHVPSFASITDTPHKQKKVGFLRRTFAYLPEYFVMLVTLVVTVSAINSLIGIGIDSLVKDDTKQSSPYYGSSYAENFSSFELVASLSALVVALPLFLILLIRIKTTEAQTPAVKTHRWRKGFLGVFIVTQSLAVIWTLSALAYDLIGRAISVDGGLFSMIGDYGADPWWQVTIVALLNALLLFYVILVVSRDYRTQDV